MTEPPGIDAAIASQVRRYRLAKGWSIRRLAEECERLGAPGLTEASLGNIERGQKEGAKRTQRRLLVEELAVLAKALEVPPILLVFPVGRESEVEVLPGVPLNTWAAVKWWMGEESLPFTRADLATNGDAWFVAAAPVAYYRSLDHLINEWALHQGAEDTEQSKQRRHELEDRLRDLRQNMRRAGLDPGGLPPFLAHIDGAEKGAGQGGRSDQAG
jgi:transcriptional regulator with XRE-family HTH domain